MDGYFGKYTGLVKDNRDSDKLGKLQVSVPSIFPPEELVNARPALPYGHFFVPEVDAKVWVEFEGGDSGLPIWTGVQYVAGEWPAEADVDPPQYRVLKTAANHVVLFNDKDGEEAIEIRDGKTGHVIKLDRSGIKIDDGKNHHQIALSAQGIAVKDGANGHEIALSSSGVKISTTAGAKIEMTPSAITIDAGAGMINLSSSALQPVLRANIDQGIGNLGAPVPLIGPGNLFVKA
jgi:hypothetical protein